MVAKLPYDHDEQRGECGYMENRYFP